MRTHRRIGLLATGLAMVSLIFGSGPGPSPAAAAPPGPSVVATIPVGRDASGIVVDPTGIWVTGWFDNELYRIDPATNAVAASYPLTIPGHGGPDAIASGLGSLWVATTEWTDDDTTVAGSVLRVDPTNGAVAAIIPVGRNAISIAVGSSAVWVANVDDGTISRIDPATNAVVATIPLTGVVTVAASGDAIRAATRTGPIVRIDPATNAVAQTVTTDAKYPLIALGDGALWATSDATGASATTRLLRIDPAGGTVTATIPLVGTETGGIATASGSVWVALWETPSVLRVDAATNAVADTVSVATPFGQGIAATATDAWLLGYATEPFAGDPTPSGQVIRITYGVAPPPSSVAWKASMGAAGAKGTAVLTAAGARGTLKLALKGLVKSAAYPVKVVTGTCARPAVTLWTAPSQKATAAGRIAKSLAIPPAKAVAIREAGAIGPVSLRVGSGSRLTCGLLTAGPAGAPAPTPVPTATPVPTPTPTATPVPTATPTPTPSAGGAVVGPYFTLVLPEGWKVLPPDEDTMEGTVEFEGPHAEAFLVGSNESSASLDDAMVRAAVAMALVGATVETTESVSIGGKPGKLLTGHTTVAGVPTFVTVAVAIAYGRLYMFILIGETQYETADKAALMAVFRTFTYRSTP